MSSKNRNLAIAAATATTLLLLLWQSFPPGDVSSNVPLDVSAPPVLEPEGSPAHLAAPTPSLAPPDNPVQMSRIYSVGLHEISGITETTPPGTRIDIWASWGPPLTKKPHVQRLLKDVTVLRIEQPFLPEGPVGVALSLAKDQVERMVWGDKYGSLAAVVIE